MSSKHKKMRSMHLLCCTSVQHVPTYAPVVKYSHNINNSTSTGNYELKDLEVSNSVKNLQFSWKNYHEIRNTNHTMQRYEGYSTDCDANKMKEITDKK